MNIALVIFNSDPARGGAERYTAELGGALAGRGHQVHLLAGRFGPPIAGVQFVPLNRGAPTRAGRYLAFLDALDAQLQRQPYDIVHAMLPVRRCDIYHPHAGMAKAAYQAGWTNQFNTKRRRYAQVEAGLLGGPHKPLVLCLSDYVKASILQCYPGIADRLEKLFNAVDLSKFDPSKHAQAGKDLRQQFNITSDKIVALLIAQHFEQKGLPQTIEALARLQQPEPVLLVVGKDDPARCAALARRLGVADRVIFAGTTDAPTHFYAAADFLVLPTRHDSCSLVVLEALAMGLPVISTIYNGACEIMTDGQHGFVLRDPADVPALAEAMRQLLATERFSAMRQACLALRPRLSLEAHLDRLEEIYRRSRGVK